jgi:hypothetical protein
MNRNKFVPLAPCHLWLVFVSLFLSLIPCYAEEIAKSANDSLDAKLGIETSLTFPIVNIYMAQLAYQFKGNNELLFGPCLQYWTDQGEAKGSAHAYSLLFGYRKYIYKQIHLEAQLFPAYNVFNSTIDGNTYKGFELWSEYRIGWKFQFKAGDYSIYLIPQPGFTLALYLENIWPGMSESTYRQNSILFVPQVILGLNF